MKKITILGLHLGYGGVEQAIINQANYLCDAYEVEIVVNYKLYQNPAFKVNEKVKIKYLMDYVPNKAEFFNSLKEHKIIKIWKEGIKAVKILYLKNKTMKDYIKNCDADIIISSRISIAKILGKYKSKNTVTITEEHCHHNNDKKYINKVKNGCKNIDYLILVSQELKNFYEKIVSSKCIYIPNSLANNPKKTSKLNRENLIAIGRISPEKGFFDLVDVTKKVIANNNNIKLNIIGDGPEYYKLSQYIKDNNLEKNIILHGFRNKEYINKMLEQSALLVMTSFEESFGIVIIEAASYGVPAIIFDSATGACELIKNDKNGIIIKNRDKDKMAGAILDLLNNQKKLKELGKNAFIESEEYSFNNVKKIWCDFIKKVI